MPKSLHAALLLVFAATAQSLAQPPTEPPPGARGNAANVPFVGRSDPDGNPVRLAKATGHVSNYDEAKVPAYRLPDPLALPDGGRVTTPGQWLAERRPQILEFYRAEVYGRVPN